MTKIDPYLHAVLLLYGAGKEINESNIISVLNASGIEIDNAKVKLLVDATKDTNIEELLKNASVATVAPATTTETKKEEKPEEDKAKKEEQAAEGLANLFG
ncbi:MAG: 50S ribosomal protein L12 [Candidatus Micrarchaeota archaeon]